MGNMLCNVAGNVVPDVMYSYMVIQQASWASVDCNVTVQQASHNAQLHCNQQSAQCHPENC